jgi:hypothetical protein
VSEDLMPTTSQIVDDPELAVLSVLDFALGAAVQALVAANPELNELDFHSSATERVLVAEHILSLIRGFQYALARYRWAVERSYPPPKDDGDEAEIPF